MQAQEEPHNSHYLELEVQVNKQQEGYSIKLKLLLSQVVVVFLKARQALHNEPPYKVVDFLVLKSKHKNNKIIPVQGVYLVKLHH